MTETNAKKSAVFALRLAWKINKKVFLAWVFASVALSVLPAIVLVLNREVISTISAFLASGEGAFSDVVGSILLLGLFVAVNDLSGGQWQKRSRVRSGATRRASWCSMSRPRRWTRSQRRIFTRTLLRLRAAEPRCWFRIASA